MKILVGLSNGLRNDEVPYQMFIVDVDAMEPIKQEWVELKPEVLNSCSNVRVNLGSYKSITQNPAEYLEAEFDVKKLIDTTVNNSEYQIINIYTDESGSPILYRTINASGEVKMHHISEFEYKKKFSIYGEDLNALPSYVKTSSIKDAYEWWRKKDKVKEKKRTRFAYENFDTCENMPVQLLYHYLTGVKGFELGYHTITDIHEKNVRREKLHEYFLFKGTANIKLKESMPLYPEETKEPVAFFGNKDPYPDTQKLGYYGAMMSLICNRKNYPAFDIYTRPTSEVNFDKEGIEVTIDITDGGMGIYNKYEETGCIEDKWRLSEDYNFFGVSLTNLLPDKLIELSKKFQNEKERIEDGHWGIKNTSEWFKVMTLALSTQFYSPELRNKLGEILKDFQMLFSKKLADMIDKISAKDTLEVMKWAEENVSTPLQNISYLKENGTIQKASAAIDQMKNLFTFKRNSFDLPDWLQIYTPETIESLGGVEYLRKFIATRGEESAELFLSIWAEKLENDQKYATEEQNDDLFGGSDTSLLVDQLEEPAIMEMIEKTKDKKVA